MKGRDVIAEGYFGKEMQHLLLIPENPPTIVDKWGNEWLYLGDTFFNEFIRIAKANENGLVDIATLGHIRMDYFPELDTNNHIY